MLKSTSIFLLPLVVLILQGCTGNAKTDLAAKDILKTHAEMLSIDSHTDTPLRMMNPGTDLGKKTDSRKSGGKVDFVRMREGGLDGIFFAVFVGQSDRDLEGNEMAKSRAMQLFDSIHAVVDRYPCMAELALRSGDLKRISSVGKSAIYIGT